MINEASELPVTTIRAIEKLTDANNHTEARYVLARTMAHTTLSAAYDKLMKMQRRDGHLSTANQNIRRRLDDKLFAMAKSMYSNYDSIHNAF